MQSGEKEFRGNSTTSHRLPRDPGKEGGSCLSGTGHGSVFIKS